MLPAPLAPLAAWPQFVAWRLEWNEQRQKYDKIPYSPLTGRKASSTNPADWSTYEIAAGYAEAMTMGGVGFVFTERDPFFFLDLDKALVAGQWSQLSQELCARLPCAVEISQSGTGLHVIGSYSARPDHRCKNIPLGLELYTAERFCALTGTGAQGSASVVLDGALAAVISQYFDPLKSPAGAPPEWTEAPVPEWSGPTDDGELLALARKSGSSTAASAFGDGPAKMTFADLWDGAVEPLAARWPSNVPGGDFDHSSADQSLANGLAFWTGKDCARMERMMRKSALARQKWDDRPDYLETTILKAVQLVGAVLQSRSAAPVPPPPKPVFEPGSAFQQRDGSTMMAHQEQLDHFAGCIYVTGPDRILTPRGEKLNQSRFDVVYGGHEFILSPDGKKTTTSAWDAFTKAQTYATPIADRLCFRPEHGSGGVIMAAGLRMANTYVDIQTEATPGDPAPYLDLLRRQLPEVQDQAILLNYMASVKQNPGMKAQWWPVLQGVKGNGKTVHITVMVHALGLQYCHLPNVDKMVRNGMNFNGWVDGKLFVGLEEVHGADRRGFFDAFKTTVTNRLIPIEGKGIEETTGDNRANGIITTNPRDGVPIDDDERRYAPLFSAQQQKSDLGRDGMTPAYFSDFHDWLFGRNAYAAHGVDYGLRVVNHFLATMPLVADLDPNQLATRAPLTSSTAEAIGASHGRVEQEILEAVGEDVQGFRGGWISSTALEKLMADKRMSIPRNRRRDMLRAIGYDWHPALAATQGRVNNVVAPDNAKPRLFCKIGSLSYLNLTEPASVAKAYSDAQGIGGAQAAFGTG